MCSSNPAYHLCVIPISIKDAGTSPIILRKQKHSPGPIPLPPFSYYSVSLLPSSQNSPKHHLLSILVIPSSPFSGSQVQSSFGPAIPLLVSKSPVKYKLLNPTVLSLVSQSCTQHLTSLPLLPLEALESPGF